MRPAEKDIQTLVSRERIWELVNCCEALSDVATTQSPHYERMVSDSFGAAQYLPEPILVGLWELLADHALDRSFAIKLSEFTNSCSKDLLYSWICQAPTLDECLKILVDNSVISNSSEQWKIRIMGDKCQLHYLVDPTKGYPYQATEHAVCSLVSLLKHLSQSQLVLTGAAFKYSEPAYSRKYLSVLDVRPQFSMDHNYIEFTREHLRTPVFNTSEYTRKILEHRATKVKKAMTSWSLSARVKQLAFDMLEHEKVVSLEVASSTLFMSKQTLARRLQCEGTSFSEIVDHARKVKAIKAMRERVYSFAEISYSLGFRDSSSFYKAFRRWFGVSPGEYLASIERANNQSGIDPVDIALLHT